MTGHYRLDPAATEWREVEGEIVGLDLRAEEYFALRGSAVLLWQRLQQEAGLVELRQMLVDTYGISPEQAAGDLEAFLDGLRGRGLLLA